jgi:hypothetical protein
MTSYVRTSRSASSLGRSTSSSESRGFWRARPQVCRWPPKATVVVGRPSTSELSSLSARAVAGRPVSRSSRASDRPWNTDKHAPSTVQARIGSSVPGRSLPSTLRLERFNAATPQRPASPPLSIVTSADDSSPMESASSALPRRWLIARARRCHRADVRVVARAPRCGCGRTHET